MNRKEKGNHIIEVYIKAIDCIVMSTSPIGQRWYESCSKLAETV